MLIIQSNIAARIHPGVFKKDPLSSDLGKQILSGSIDLLVEIGFEDFTFKKLSKLISTTEASVYRYFENKHNLLTYLTMWYWNWLHYKCAIRTLNIECPKKRLENAIIAMTEPIARDMDIEHIDETKLHQVVITESAKAYHCKQVDKDNKEGFFTSYKNLVADIAEIVQEIDPKYPYPRMLVSTIIEGAHQQRYFAEHLPRLTDAVKGKDAVIDFYVQIMKRELQIV